MRSSHSPTIRSRYDYFHAPMSPELSGSNLYDNQNQSLFGDPVSRSTDFLETLDNHLYGGERRRRRSSQLSSSDCMNKNAFMNDYIESQNNNEHRLQMPPNYVKNTSSTSPNSVIDSTFHDDYQCDAKRRSRCFSSSFTDELRANLDPFE